MQLNHRDRRNRKPVEPSDAPTWTAVQKSVTSDPTPTTPRRRRFVACRDKRGDVEQYGLFVLRRVEEGEVKISE